MVLPFKAASVGNRTGQDKVRLMAPTDQMWYVHVERFEHLCSNVHTPDATPRAPPMPLASHARYLAMVQIE